MPVDPKPEDKTKRNVRLVVSGVTDGGGREGGQMPFWQSDVRNGPPRFHINFKTLVHINLYYTTAAVSCKALRKCFLNGTCIAKVVLSKSNNSVELSQNKGEKQIISFILQIAIWLSIMVQISQGHSESVTSGFYTTIHLGSCTISHVRTVLE